MIGSTLEPKNVDKVMNKCDRGVSVQEKLCKGPVNTFFDFLILFSDYLFLCYYLL